MLLHSEPQTSYRLPLRENVYMVCVCVVLIRSQHLPLASVWKPPPPTPLPASGVTDRKCARLRDPESAEAPKDGGVEIRWLILKLQAQVWLCTTLTACVWAQKAQIWALFKKINKSPCGSVCKSEKVQEEEEKPSAEILGGLCGCKEADISIRKVRSHSWFVCFREPRWTECTACASGKGINRGGGSALNDMLTRDKLVRTCWLQFGPKE